jgi:hypothetical protein
MPLLDLLADPTAFKFESKTRAFGMDMPGGGYSGLPYIQFGIDDDNTNNPFRKYFQTNKLSLDFPVRGGSVTQVLGETAETPTAAIDRLRIDKFLKDDPRGNSFVLKQKGLQLSNPKVQTGDAFYRTLEDTVPGLFQNTQIYNDSKNLLAQVGTMGTGNHITRIGNVINNVQEKYYSDIVGKELNMAVDEVQKTNRLAILSNLKLDQKATATFLGVQYTSNVSGNSNDYVDSLTLERLGISPLRNRLFSYLGGPGSIYGIGTTTIRRATDTTEAADFELPDGTPMSDLAYTYSTIKNKTGKTLPNLNGIINNYQDFRDDLAGVWKYDQWTDKNKIDVRFFDGRVDKLNKIAPYNLDKAENPFKTDAQPLDQNGKSVTKENTQDIIKFGFECLSNSSFEDNTVLLFRAYLASITDTNSATYNPFKYMGRGENFYVYQGFDRGISFSFKIAIGSYDELNSSYQKLNYLISQVYPDYNQFTNFMTAPLVRLTIGDYLYRVHGFLESVNVTIEQNNSWEIEDGQQLPHTLDVAITFKPILNQLPRRGRGMSDVPSIIRQTNVPETPDEAYNPAQQNTNNSQQTDNLNLNGNNDLGGVNTIDSFGMNLSTPTNVTPPAPINESNSPAKQQAKKVANKKAAVKKSSDNKKATAGKSSNTTTKPTTTPKPVVAPTPSAPAASVASLGIPTFQTFK